MKQAEKFALDYSNGMREFERYVHDKYGKWVQGQPCCESAGCEGFKSGFQKALDCVTLYLKYKHRFGTINEFDINFEDIQRIADTEVEE